MGRNTTGRCFRHEIVMVNAMERGQSTSDPGMPAPGDCVPTTHHRGFGTIAAWRIGRDSVCNRRHFTTVACCLQSTGNVIASRAWGRGMKRNLRVKKTTLWEETTRCSFEIYHSRTLGFGVRCSRGLLFISRRERVTMQYNNSKMPASGWHTYAVAPPDRLADPPIRFFCQN